MRLILPHPPSINHYYRHVGKNVVISSEGRKYRKTIEDMLAAEEVSKAEGRLAVRLQVAPPDRRRRDLDNVQKPLLDALCHGGAYADDSQIDFLLTERAPISKGGYVIATIAPDEPSICRTALTESVFVRANEAMYSAIESLVRMAGEWQQDRPRTIGGMVEQVEAIFYDMKKQLEGAANGLVV